PCCTRRRRRGAGSRTRPRRCRGTTAARGIARSTILGGVDGTRRTRLYRTRPTLRGVPTERGVCLGRCGQTGLRRPCQTHPAVRGNRPPGTRTPTGRVAGDHRASAENAARPGVVPSGPTRRLPRLATDGRAGG